MRLLTVVICLAIGLNTFIRVARGHVREDVTRKVGVHKYIFNAKLESIDDPNQKDDKIIKFGENGRFVAGRNDVLGEGGYGKVYRAFDTQTSHVVAVKIERKKLEIPAILTEKYVYQAIGPFRGIPKIYSSGISSDGTTHFLAMQLLGKSLAKLQIESNGQFSPKTVYMLGIQLMYRIELLHSKRFLHRDIKPGNMGVGLSGQLIYIFDFGLSERFVDADGKHVQEGRQTSYGSGTPRYMSAYAHSHNTQSRRDDMEAIGYVLMLFLRGNLPWDSVRGYEEPAYKSKMVRMKETLDFQMLCNGFAKQMVQYFQHVRYELGFATKPNYPYLRGLFRQALADMGEKEDYLFDWHVQKP